jgi:hypothetical protein
VINIIASLLFSYLILQDSPYGTEEEKDIQATPAKQWLDVKRFRGKNSDQSRGVLWYYLRVMYIIFRVVYCFDTGSLASIGIDIPYTGTGRLVFGSVFLGVRKFLADVMV